MSITSVHIRMKFVEGALPRLLGLVTRRGFGIAGVEARRSHCGRRYEIALELLGDRSIENIERQIAKLYEVEGVRVMHSTEPLPFRSYVNVPTSPFHAAV